MRDSPEGLINGARNTLRRYLDFTLCIIGGLSFLFGVAFAQESRSAYSSPIEWKIAVGCFVLMIICVMASRNRLTVLAVSVACPSAFLFLKFFSSRDVGALWRGAVFLALGMAILALRALSG